MVRMQQQLRSTAPDQLVYVLTDGAEEPFERYLAQSPENASVTRLGVNVPNFGPTATPENLLGWIRFAEQHGFALGVMSDHIAPTPDVSAQYPRRSTIPSRHCRGWAA